MTINAISADYLPHIEAAITRLGYIKSVYAACLADLMSQHEGVHPSQIARIFRQRGVQLPNEAKRAHGIRANTDMTAEAMDALTQRGLSAPIKGLETTLLEAAFSFLRARTADNPPAPSHCILLVQPSLPGCAACSRLNGSVASPELQKAIPPHDCEQDACSIGFRWSVDYTAIGLEKYHARINGTSEKGSS